MNKKTTYMLFIFYIAFIMILSIKEVNADSDDMEINEYRPYEVGDYFQFEFEFTEYLESLIDENEEFDTYNILINDYNISMMGMEAIEIKGELHNCWIMQIKAQMKYELIGNDDVKKSTQNDVLIQKEWINQDTFILNKKETIYTYNENVEYSDDYIREKYDYEFELIEKYTFTDIPEADPLPLKVGKTWSVKESYLLNTTIKNRERYDDDDFSDWDFDYEETSETETINYEVISQNENVVPAGTFTTLKVKNQVVGESDYDFYYYNQNGMIIQLESYVENSLDTIIKLKSYKYTNAEKNIDENGEEKNLFIPLVVIGVIIIFIISIIIAILVIIKSKREKNDFTVSIPQTSQPQQSHQPILPPPAPPSSNLPVQQPHAEIKKCPMCNNPLNFPTTPKYCPFCNNQLLK